MYTSRHRHNLSVSQPPKRGHNLKWKRICKFNIHTLSTYIFRKLVQMISILSHTKPKSLRSLMLCPTRLYRTSLEASEQVRPSSVSRELLFSHNDCQSFIPRFFERLRMWRNLGPAKGTCWIWRVFQGLCTCGSWLSRTESCTKEANTLCRCFCWEGYVNETWEGVLPQPQVSTIPAAVDWVSYH